MTFLHDFHRVMVEHYTGMLKEAKGWKHKQWVKDSLNYHKSKIDDSCSDILLPVCSCDVNSGNYLRSDKLGEQVSTKDLRELP